MPKPVACLKPGLLPYTILIVFRTPETLFCLFHTVVDRTLTQPFVFLLFCHAATDTVWGYTSISLYIAKSVICEAVFIGGEDQRDGIGVAHVFSALVVETELGKDFGVEGEATELLKRKVVGTLSTPMQNIAFDIRDNRRNPRRRA